MRRTRSRRASGWKPNINDFTVLSQEGTVVTGISRNASRSIRCTLPFRPARSAGTIGAAIGNAACRASSRLIAAAVVVLALGLASPAQVQAQDVLVGNVDQSAGGNASLAKKDYAQGFTTGSAGAQLSSVRVDFHTGGTDNFDQVFVRLVESSSFTPTGTTVTSLGLHGGLPIVPVTGENTLVPPHGRVVNLEPNTAYFLVFSAGSSTTTAKLAITHSADEDSGGESGWVIANLAQSKPHGPAGTESWNSLDRGAVKIQLRTPTPLYLTVSDAEGNEEDTDPTLDFVVRLVGTLPGSSGKVAVSYEALSGTATVGRDFWPPSDAAPFKLTNSSRQKTISVPIIDDRVEDSGEWMKLVVTRAYLTYQTIGELGSTIDHSGLLATQSPGIGTIYNSEEEPSELSVADAEATKEDDATLDFVVTLDPAAAETVTVDYATSDGTATAGSDYTATSGTLTFDAGDASKTISVPIIDDTVDDGGETLTLTLTNASGADIAGAEATGTIQNNETATTPLTASFADMPASHDGDEFSFRVSFSQPVASRRRVVRNAFAVTGGSVSGLVRVGGQSDLWTIKVEPSSNGETTIELPAGRGCDSGGICTEDGWTLSNALSATVAGPVGISVADARVEEAAGAVLGFAVTLSRAASGTVTVDYGTTDGSAQAAVDYTAASGTLSFQAGESSKTIEVAVLDDSHDEGEETLTLTLSNASGGRISDRNATGTIENQDALPRALIARFGRTAAVHIVNQVEERVNAPRAPGFDGRVAGRQINRNMGQDFALDFLQQLGGGAGYGHNIGQPQGRMNAAGGNDPRFGNGGHDIKPRTANRNRGGDEPERDAGAAPGRRLRERHEHGARKRATAGRLELRAQPRNVQRRRALLLEPQRAVAVLRPGRRPSAARAPDVRCWTVMSRRSSEFVS